MNIPYRRRIRIALLLAAAVVSPLSTPGTAHAQTYWFEDYERAVDMIDDGRMAEASALLERLVREHPLPQASVRVPGDRFINYLPYYQQARVQLHQGDTTAASRSLDICEAFGVAKQNRRTARQFTELRRRIAEKASAATAHARRSGIPPARTTTP